MEENKVITVKELIYEVRGQKVMLDSDLARLYEIETGALNRAVKRNLDRFPDIFMFQLTEDEANSLRCQIGISNNNKGGRRYLPYVFTEHGVLMLSSVLNSKKAISVNIEIMITFIEMRRHLMSQDTPNDQIEKLQKLLMLHIDNCDYKFTEYDGAIEQIIEAINGLSEKPKEAKRIGF